MAGDPYKELGVPKSASQDEIKKAFRKLAKDLHPDKNPGNKAAEERFKRITAAFDLLGDADKRKKYDRGEIDADGREQYAGFNPNAGGGPFGRGGGFGGGQAQGAGLDDIDLEELFGGIFGARAGGGAGGARGASARGAGGGRAGGFAPKGSDIRATLEISLEDAITGNTQRIQFTDGRMLDVSIPKGSSDGQVIRLKGQGAPGMSVGGAPGKSGDALIELKIAKHPVFSLDGANLMMDQPVPLYDAVLGGKIRVRTPEGQVSMTIPKGSNSGQVLRLKGKGAFENGKRGDLLAKLMIMLPPDDAALDKLAQASRDAEPIKPFRD